MALIMEKDSMMAHDGVQIILKIQLDPNGPKLHNNVE
jgi:hypothetical protein